MKLKPDLFPYPVLNADMDDYVDSTFDFEMKITNSTKKQFDIEFSFKIKNDSLSELIKGGKASFAVHLEGISSSYRRFEVIKNGGEYVRISISADEISSNIDVNAVLIANESINGYRNSSFNSDYYSENYKLDNINRGDILAFCNTRQIDINLENFEKPSARSIIRVSAKKQNFMDIDLSSDTINVSIPQDDHKAYIELSRSTVVRQKVLLSLIVLPAITYTLERMIKDDVGDEQLGWYRVITQIFEDVYGENQHLKDQDALSVAQRILNHPLENALVNLQKESDNLCND